MGKFYKINQYIQAKEVRVIGADGKQIGILPIFQAIQEARKQGADLIEISPNANPPVCKLMDFKKFKYQEAKKERESKKGQKGGDLKEIRLTPFIAKNDFDVRIRRAKEFLGEGNKVRLTVRFVGRQLGHKEFGQEVLGKAIKELEAFSKKDSEAKWQGKDFFITLSSDNKKESKKNEQKNENQEVSG